MPIIVFCVNPLITPIIQRHFGSVNIMLHIRVRHVFLYSWYRFVGCSSSQNLLSLWTQCSLSCARRIIRLHSFMSTITHRWPVSGGFGLNGQLVESVSLLNNMYSVTIRTTL